MKASCSRIARTLFAAGTAAAFLSLAPSLGDARGDLATAKGCPGSGMRPYEISAKQAREAVTCVLNQKRRAHGRSALKPRRALRSAARRHSGYMEKHHCFSHRCAGEAGLQRRIAKTSYLPCNCTWGLGENIGWATRAKATPRRVVRRWMNSSAHRSEILNPQFDHVGVGVVWGSIKNSHAKGGVYTADFGFKR